MVTFLIDVVLQRYVDLRAALGCAGYGRDVKWHGGGIPTATDVTYIGAMLRSLGSRIAALTLATLVGVSAPALAIAHGYAHHEGDHAGQDRDYHPAQGPAVTDALHDGVPPSIHATNVSNGHIHLPIARALSVRMDAPLFVLLPAGAEVPPSIVFGGTASLLLTAAPARSERAEASPRQPRAPPLG